MGQPEKIYVFVDSGEGDILKLERYTAENFNKR